MTGWAEILQGAIFQQEKALSLRVHSKGVGELGKSPISAGDYLHHQRNGKKKI